MSLVIRKSSHVANGVPLCGGSMATGKDGLLPPTGILGNLFDEITKAESVSGSTEYRCVYLENPATNVNPAGSPRVRIVSHSESEIALATLQKGIQADSISTEKDAPSNGTFYTQSEIDNRGTNKYLTFPNTPQLLPGEYCALWLRRKTKAATGSGKVTEEVVLDFAWDE